MFTGGTNCLLNKRAYKSKIIKSFKVFITSGRLYNYFSNAITVQNISGNSSAIWNCLVSLFTLQKRKSVPLLYTHETFSPKNSRAKFEYCHPPPTTLHHMGLFQISSGPFKQKNIPSKDKNLPSLTQCHRPLRQIQMETQEVLPMVAPME